MEITEYFAGLDYFIQLISLTAEMPWVSLFDDEGDLTDSKIEDKVDTVPFNTLINNYTEYADSTVYNKCYGDNADYCSYSADLINGCDVHTQQNKVYGGNIGYLFKTAESYFEKYKGVFLSDSAFYGSSCNGMYGGAEYAYFMPKWITESYAKIGEPYLYGVGQPDVCSAKSLSIISKNGGDTYGGLSALAVSGSMANSSALQNVSSVLSGLYYAAEGFNAYSELQNSLSHTELLQNSLNYASEKSSISSFEGGLTDITELFNSVAVQSDYQNVMFLGDKYNKLFSDLTSKSDNVDNLFNYGGQSENYLSQSVSSELIGGRTERQEKNFNINVDFKAYADVRDNRDIEKFAQVFVKWLEQELTELDFAEGIHY